MSTVRLSKDEPLARSLAEAIHAGQIETVKELVQTHPGLAAARLGAELNGTPSWGDSTAFDVADFLGTGRESLLTWLKEQGAKKPVDAV